MSNRKYHSHLHTPHLRIGSRHVLMSFLKSNDEVIDLVCSGMFAERRAFFLTSSLSLSKVLSFAKSLLATLEL